MLRSIITKCLAGIFMVGLAVQAGAQVQAEVHVDANIQLHRIDRRIFGQFIEHYCRVVEHGLWAELLENRKFYPFDAIGQMNLAAPWTGDPKDKDSSYCHRPLHFRGRGLLPTHHPRGKYARLARDSARWIRCSGWKGICGTCVDKIHTRRINPPHSRWKLRRAQPWRGRRFILKPGDWQRYDFKLTPAPGLHPAVFRIMFNHAGVVWIGAASLMPGDNIDGIRRDVVELGSGPWQYPWCDGRAEALRIRTIGGSAWARVTSARLIP